MPGQPKDWLITSMDGSLFLRTVQWRPPLGSKPITTWTPTATRAMLFTVESAKTILNHLPHLKMLAAAEVRSTESVSPSEAPECDCEVCARKRGVV